MEKNTKLQKWRIRGKQELCSASGFTVRGVLDQIRAHLNSDDDRPIIHIGAGDPSTSPCFRTTIAAENAVIDTLRSAAFNCYSPSVGLLPARMAIAEYLSRDLPYKLSPDDVYLTVGCNHSIEVAMEVLAGPGANILLPRPGYPAYESRAEFSKLEVRHFDLLPQRGWEVDLDSIETLVDENTVAIVIINPGNPCGNVYSYQHLQQVAETARKHGILVIADEVYGHLTYGSNPFVPMGVFGSVAPVLTLGSISKEWIVPGWRLGWVVTTDPTGLFKQYGITECLNSYLQITCDPVTFIQGAVPQIIEKTKPEFISKIIDTLRIAVDICWEKIEGIPCITCPYKPQGGMFAMAKLDLSVLDGIKDDFDFSTKLAKEESVIILPGFAVGMKNWLRISFAIEPTLLEEAFERIKAFCQRHSKKQ